MKKNDQSPDNDIAKSQIGPADIEIEELFARLTMALEDAAGVAADGQRAGQSTDAKRGYVSRINQHLIEASRIVSQINDRIGHDHG